MTNRIYRLGLPRCPPIYAVGTTNVKAKVQKDGHSFFIHIVDPELEMSEEIPLNETETEWHSSVETFSEQNSGTPEHLRRCHLWHRVTTFCLISIPAVLLPQCGAAVTAHSAALCLI